MLVVGRKEGQSILIGDNIRVMVVSIRHGSVRLGFEAPRDIRIMRTELLERIERDSELDEDDASDLRW